MGIFAEHVIRELDRAREKYDRVNSLHEGYAVILEGLDEFWELVKLGRKRLSRAQLALELIQVAAMCQRTVEDLRLPMPTVQE